MAILILLNLCMHRRYFRYGLESSLECYFVVDVVGGLLFSEQLIVQRDALINEIQCIKQQYADAEEQLRFTHQVELNQGQGSPECNIPHLIEY